MVIAARDNDQFQVRHHARHLIREDLHVVIRPHDSQARDYVSPHLTFRRDERWHITQQAGQGLIVVEGAGH
jgi:hypothetical protein